jgi:hypothetical protein
MKLILVIALIIGGWYLYTSNKKEVDTVATSVATATKESIDIATQKSFGGVGTNARVYYLRNRNYGSSAKNSICTASTSNGGLGDIVGAMQKLGSTVSCIVDPNFPSKSFTLTVPSAAHKGQHYCTDQNGFIGLIPSLTSAPFSLGFACK